jgi:hypothetical protein
LCNDTCRTNNWPSQGVSTLSAVDVTDEERAALWESVAAQVARIVETESHERTLCAALDALRVWTVALRAPLPDAVLHLYKVSRLFSCPCKHYTYLTTYAFSNIVNLPCELSKYAR